MSLSREGSLISNETSERTSPWYAAKLVMARFSLGGRATKKRSPEEHNVLCNKSSTHILAPLLLIQPAPSASNCSFHGGEAGSRHIASKVRSCTIQCRPLATCNLTTPSCAAMSNSPSSPSMRAVTRDYSDWRTLGNPRIDMEGMHTPPSRCAQAILQVSATGLEHTRCKVSLRALLDNMVNRQTHVDCIPIPRGPSYRTEACSGPPPSAVQPWVAYNVRPCGRGILVPDIPPAYP